MPAITPEIRDRIVALFDEGRHRNEIARELGVSGPTVTRVCRDAGREFDRANDILELRAAKVDLDDMRERVAKKMLIVADDTLSDLDAPHLVYNFGGKENTYAEHLLDEAPLAAKLDALRGASLAVDKATRIVERAPTGAGEALGILDTLAAGFELAAQQIRAEESEPRAGSTDDGT
ncbi:Homeodomain-like domain-containing protein [Microbacterium sp. SLBN-154]|uniref:helix-turn-helix domain-containing protein n=1 Tax=Microbacterium sp. SLBN-154 TaxID=2768458 RepID=UPI0011747756|nr:helix-turn-helix domain-containing protein [Microbacterium sp. SLBN-154]TQK19106.1 Homeodomain-like domain-containing protein [Microbacterium sp. SLBN-154]